MIKNNLIPTLKKYWLRVVVLLSGVLLLISAIVQVITPPIPVAPPPETIQGGYNNVQTDFSNLQLVGTPPSIPEELAVYTVVPMGLSPLQVEESFIRTYRLEQVPGESIWVNESYNFSKNPEGEYVFVTVDGEYPPEVISQPAALSAANEFIQRFFPGISVVPVESEIQYMGGFSELEIVNRNRATVVMAPYAYAIGEYPVLFDRFTQYPFMVFVSAAYQVQKISFQPLFVNFVSPISYQTISAEEAVRNIERGLGTLLSASHNGGFGEIALDSVVSGSLSQARIEYRVDAQQQYAYPYYAFEGRFTNNLGVEFFGTVISPAIKTSDL